MYIAQIERSEYQTFKYSYQLLKQDEMQESMSLQKIVLDVCPASFHLADLPMRKSFTGRPTQLLRRLEYASVSSTVALALPHFVGVRVVGGDAKIDCSAVNRFPSGVRNLFCECGGVSTRVLGIPSALCRNELNEANIVSRNELLFDAQ